MDEAGQRIERSGAGAGEILVGTSGYSYTEWVEAGFYPAVVKSAQMLPHYARVFPVTELNFTWYQMPRAEALERLRLNAPAHFQFAAKLTRTLTHEVEANQWRQQATAFRDGIAPLLQARQLLAVLVQLPPDFDRTPAHRRYLADLLDELASLPLAVEFRHVSWAQDRVFTELTRRRITLVSLDGPKLPGLFPGLAVETNPALFYLRLHGRNARGWQSGNMQKKFDYDYTEKELAGLISSMILPLASQARRGLIFFNNHVAGHAPKNALSLVTLLRREGLGVNAAALQSGEEADDPL